MKYPDDGYRIPDENEDGERWRGYIDEDTGLTVYPDDEEISRRIEIAKAAKTENRGNGWWKG